MSIRPDFKDAQGHETFVDEEAVTALLIGAAEDSAANNALIAHDDDFALPSVRHVNIDALSLDI